MKKTGIITWTAGILWICIMILIYFDKLKTGGFLGFGILILPILLTVYAVIKKIKGAIPLLVIVLIVGGLNLLRCTGREQIKEYIEDEYYYTVYELNPGAMGSTSYLKNKYKTIFDIKVLSVKWCIESTRSKYSDFI